MMDNLRERERREEKRREEKVPVKVEILGVCLLILHFFFALLHLSLFLHLHFLLRCVWLEVK